MDRIKVIKINNLDAVVVKKVEGSHTFLTTKDSIIMGIDVLIELIRKINELELLRKGDEQ